MEKILENLAAAQKMVQTADHMIYVTFPLIKDKRLLFKILYEMKNANALCINSILQYEHLYRRIHLYKEPQVNFKIFLDKCAPRYGITQSEVKLMLELFDLVKMHKESPFEFLKNDKLVILSDNLKPKTLTIEKTKEFMIATKSILKKSRELIK